MRVWSFPNSADKTKYQEYLPYGSLRQVLFVMLIHIFPDGVFPASVFCVIMNLPKSVCREVMYVFDVWIDDFNLFALVLIVPLLSSHPTAALL